MVATGDSPRVVRSGTNRTRRAGTGRAGRPPRPRHAWLACWPACWPAWLALSCALAASSARAEERALPLVTRGTLGAALMTSPDQTGRLGFDTFGATARLQLGYAFAPWLDLHLGFGANAFPRAQGDSGAAVAPTVGVLATLPGALLRPFAYTDFGVAFTGPLSRPYFHGALGLDVQLTRAFTIGPLLGYAHLFQNNGPRYSSDARSIELCATVTFRPVRDEPPRPRTMLVYHDRVEEIAVPPPSAPSPELDVLLDAALPKARVELLAPVLFKLASDELEPIGVAMLHEVARELKARQDIRLLEIQGNADSRGSERLNAELSARRAQRVLDWLVEHGVERERLRTAAHGAGAPVEHDAQTEAAHEQNRRVVFRVIEAVTP